MFNEVSIVRVHKDKVLALVGDLHDNVIANYEKFLQEGYVEMSEKRNSGHEKEKFEQQIDQLVGVGANTTYH